MGTPGWLLELPGPVRAVVVGGAGLGALGCLAGLVIGLVVHPPTAWAAVVEVGLPAAVVGAALGLLVHALRLVPALHRRRPGGTQLR